MQATLSTLTLLTKYMCIYVLIVVICSIIPSSQQHQVKTNQPPIKKNAGNHNFLTWSNAESLIKSVPFMRTSSSMQRIYDCIHDNSILHCTKLFVLQRLEEPAQFEQTGNLTSDFMQQFFGAREEQADDLMSEKYTNISEDELNKRLIVNFQRFFKNRDIKLNFLPGIMVKIVPSKENKLKFTLKKKKKRSRSLKHKNKRFIARATRADGELDDNFSVLSQIGIAEVDAKKQGGGGDSSGGGNRIGPIGVVSKLKSKKQKSYKNTIIQMAVPAMFMPAIILGTMLPFILPMLKMATIMTLLMNNSAFIAALIYAARTHANAQEEQQISYNYGHGGFH